MRQFILSVIVSVLLIAVVSILKGEGGVPPTESTFEVIDIKPDNQWTDYINVTMISGNRQLYRRNLNKYYYVFFDAHEKEKIYFTRTAWYHSWFPWESEQIALHLHNIKELRGEQP